MLVRLRSEGNALAEAKAQLEKLQQGAAQAQGVFAKLGDSLKGAFNLSQAREAASHLGELKDAAANLPNIAERLGAGDLPGAIAGFRQLGSVLAGLATTPLGAIGIGVAGLGAYGYTQLKAAREMREASDAMVAATNAKNLPKVNELLNSGEASGVLSPDAADGLRARLQKLMGGEQALSQDRSLGSLGGLVNPSRNKAEIERIKAATVEAVGPDEAERIRAYADAHSSGFAKYIELLRAGLQEAILKEQTAILRDTQKATTATPGTQAEAARAEMQGHFAIVREGYNLELTEGQQTLQKVLRNRLATNEEQLAAINEFFNKKRSITANQSAQEEDAAALELGLAQKNQDRLAATKNADPDQVAKAKAAVEAAQAAMTLAQERGQSQQAQVEAEYQGALLDQKERAFAKEMRLLQIHNAEVHRAVRESNQQQQDEERNAVVRRTQITTSFALTKEEQDKLRIKSLNDEAAGLEKIIALRQQLADEALAAYRKAQADPSIRPEKLNLLEASASFTSDSLDQAKRRRNDLSVERTQIESTPNPAKWSDQWTLALTRMRAETQGLAQYVTGTLTGALDHAIGGASNALAGAVLQTRGWQLELQRLPITIGIEIVSAIIKMGIQWLVTQTIMKAASAWLSPAGGAASIIGGLGGMAFADGGVTPAQATLAWVGEKGPEVVIPANVTARMSPQERADAISGRGYGQGSNNGGMSIVVAPSPEQAQRISREHMDAMWVDSARRNIHRFR